MELFKCRSHKWRLTHISNVLQQDSMGYPLRLCIVECSKCGKPDQIWMDVAEESLKELETGESVLLEWRKI